MAFAIKFALEEAIISINMFGFSVVHYSQFSMQDLVVEEAILHRWLLYHGYATVCPRYRNQRRDQRSQQWRRTSDHIFHRNHSSPKLQHFVINMALNSPVPHPWCWFCHSFGRFNCFLFHILQRHDTVPPVRPPGQLPLYLRQSSRSYPATPPPPPPASTQAVAPAPNNNWGFSITHAQQQQQSSSSNQQPAQQQAQQPTQNGSGSHPPVGKKSSEKIGYYEIEIRPNVKNIPADLNRYIPYRIHSPRQDSSTSTDSSSCESPTSDIADEMGHSVLWEPAVRTRKPRKK